MHTKNIKKIIFASLLLLVSMGSCAFVFWQINVKNKEAISHIEETQTELDRRNKITSLNMEIKNLSKERESLNSHFANRSNIVPFLDDLQKLAFSAGANAEITAVDIDPKTNGLIVEMKSVGNFSSIYKLLSLLENSQYQISFSSVKILVKSVSDKDKKITKREWEGFFKLTLLSFSNN